MKYKAFISYKHGRSTKFCECIEKSLKSYAKPLFRSPIKVFRDEKHLVPSMSLPKLIHNALDESEFLLLVASEESATSPWVKDELEYWCGTLNRVDRLIFILSQGSIVIQEENKHVDWSATTALPQFLSSYFQDVPLYIDLSWVKNEDELSLDNLRFKTAINQLSARLNGKDPNDMMGQEVLQHRRNLRFRNIGISFLVLLTLIAGSASLVANNQRRKAFQNLAQAYSKEARRLQTGGDVLSARLLYAEALTLNRSQEARRGLAETWTAEIDWEWSSDPANQEISSNNDKEQLGVNKLIFLKDSKLLISGGRDGFLRAWNLETGDEVSTKDTGMSIYTIALDTDADRLFIGGDKAKLQIWKLNQQNFLKDKELSVSGPILKLVPSPVHKDEVFVGMEGKGIALISTESGDTKWSLGAHGNSVEAIGVSPDGQKLYWAGNDAWLWRTDFTQNKAINRRIIKSDGWTSDLALSKDGSFIVHPVLNGQLQLLDLEQEMPVGRTTGHADQVLAIDMSEKFAVSAANDGTVNIWSLKNGKLVSKLPVYPEAVTDVVFDSASGKLATASLDGKIRLYSVKIPLNQTLKAPSSILAEGIKEFKAENPDIYHPLEGTLNTSRYWNWVISLSFLSSDELVVSSKDGPISVWNVKTQRQLREIPTRPGLTFDNSIAISHKPARALVAPFDLLNRQKLELWDLEQGKILWEKDIEDADVISVALSKDTSMIAFATNDQNIEVIDSDFTETSGHWIQKLSSPAVDLTWWEEKETLIALTQDGNVWSWNPRENEEAVQLFDSEERYTRLHGLQAGLLVLSNSNAIKVIDLRNIERSWNTTADVEAAALSHDARWLAWASSDGSISIVSPTSGDVWMVIAGARGIQSLAFDSSQKLLAVGRQDETIAFIDISALNFVESKKPQELLRLTEKSSGLTLKGFSVVHK